ncbi:hypothetical protein BABINDRAFT_36614 [Babjeviella inositovora NRRL Y-12698]|uniref:Transcription initiation factor IIB n=1 Tax=Babjeviella inositovora NRRL Y-12698 TaxID=984486 RepID=A0A1E3QQ46_9ASCO|nr:uncharacterized protein BABINDRAFT_36614 [Babjeviella inositovora NRRL Y-12698]ODQ79829.1 hypothetical protein BABINDRAFT_36614 [Babjeviella inositovora NRRL Y-12698]
MDFDGPNLSIILTCPECKVYPPELVERFSEGDVVCALCGLVLSDKVVDTRSEWRTFSNDDQNGDDPSRVGDAGNPLLDGENLSTMISFAQDNSRAGRELNRAQSKNLADKKDHALQAAFAKISQMCDGYQLPKIVQDGAKEVYKLVREERPLKGKSQESIMAAAIFIGCRKANVARTFKEIWALTNVPRKEIGKVFKIMNKVINEKKLTNPLLFTNATERISQNQTSAEDLIRRFCSHLGLSPQVTNAAEHLARSDKDVGVLSGRSPITIAASIIYMAVVLFGANLPVAKIAEKTGVSDSTIKTSFKYLWEARERLVDPHWVESGKVKLEETPKS